MAFGCGVTYIFFSYSLYHIEFSSYYLKANIRAHRLQEYPSMEALSPRRLRLTAGNY